MLGYSLLLDKCDVTLVLQEEMVCVRPGSAQRSLEYNAPLPTYPAPSLSHLSVFDGPRLGKDLDGVGPIPTCSRGSGAYGQP